MKTCSSILGNPKARPRAIFVPRREVIARGSYYGRGILHFVLAVLFKRLQSLRITNPILWISAYAAITIGQTRSYL